MLSLQTKSVSLVRMGSDAGVGQRVGAAGGLAGCRAAPARSISAGCAGAVSGDTTPIEMTYFSASSTLIVSSITSARGIIRKKPEVGLGVVGT